MREKLKYFVLNKAFDYNRGICVNLKADGNTLSFSGGVESGVGRYLSRVFDSGENGMTWHRMVINAENSSSGDFRVTVYAADETEIKYNGEKRTIQEIFRDNEISFDLKCEIFSPFEKKKISGACDILLHDVSGQYLWFLLEVYSRSDVPAAIKDIMIYLPANTWIDYLPQIYRRSDKNGRFLERFLAVFQTMYEELDLEISEISRHFDPECAKSSFLLWLADWLDISDSYLWPEDKLRKLLLRAISLYRIRGTKESLSQIIELYTGEKPYIIEEFSIKRFVGSDYYENTLLPMYGDNPYTVVVLIKSELVKSTRDYNVLLKIAEEMKPVTMEIKLVLLDPYIFLNNFSYIGINSVLGQYRQAALDGKSKLTLSIIQHQLQEEEKHEEH